MICFYVWFCELFSFGLQILFGGFWWKVESNSTTARLYTMPDGNLKDYDSSVKHSVLFMNNPQAVWKAVVSNMWIDVRLKCQTTQRLRLCAAWVKNSEFHLFFQQQASWDVRALSRGIQAFRHGEQQAECITTWQACNSTHTILARLRASSRRSSTVLWRKPLKIVHVAAIPFICSPHYSFHTCFETSISAF